jgi:ferredoxin
MEFWGMIGFNQRMVSCLTIAVLIAVCASLQFVQPAQSCYGPHISADIDRTEININQTVTLTGIVCPAAENKTVRIAYTRPDYTYVEDYVLSDPVTGTFADTQTLDMAGYWNIFAIDGHICDRLYAVVTDPANPDAPPPSPSVPLNYKPNWSVIGVTAALLSIGGVIAFLGRKHKTMNISSYRFLIQVGLIFIIFFGIFIDHYNMPIPAAQIATHELDISTSVFGVGMPDGLSAPFLGCYYPCGRIATCVLWQIQVYIYPFFDVGGGWGVHYDATGAARLAVVFGILIVASVISGRVWCGWVCPFGFYIDLITRIRKRLKVRRRLISDAFAQRVHQLSYLLLALLIILSVIFASQSLAGVQLVDGTEKGGFVYTYFSAPFCQVCPVKPLCVLTESSVGLMRPEWLVQNTTGQFWQLGYYITSTNLIILAIVTAAAFFFRRSWCQICPLGGLIALFNRFKPFRWISGVRLDKVEEKCTKCGICKRVCPTQVKELYEQKSGDVASAQCIFCLRCVEMCPEKDALQFKFAGKTVLRSRNWLKDSNTSKNME